MASGLGTFDGSAVALKSGGSVGGLASATVSQSINTTNRTVTITVTGYAGYKRLSGGNWSVSQGTAFWGTTHSDAYLRVTIDGQSSSITKNIGVASSKSQTVTTGTVCTIPNGKAQARSGYSAQTSYSRTFSYDSAGSAITKSWSVTVHEYGNDSYNSGWHDLTVSGSVTTDAIGGSATYPSGLGVDTISTTWNSVKGRVFLTDYGVGTGTKDLEMIVVTEPYVAGLPQRYHSTTSGATSLNATVNNSSTCGSLSGCIDIKGASDYYIGVYANNGSLVTRYAYPNKVYTAPAPLQSLTYSQTQNAADVTISATITGGNSTNNSSNTVTTQYRYSTDGGSTYTNWASAGTGTAWTAKSASFTCSYGASVVIQARQAYQGQYSEVKQVSFTATTGTAPSAGTVTITGSTWESVTLSASDINYGTPSAAASRKSVVGVSTTVSPYTYKRETSIGSGTSGTGTVNNSSTSGGSGQPFTLKGMLPVYAYLWVDNTSKSKFVDEKTTAYYLPPAPGVVSYTDDFYGYYTIRYVGDTAKNVADYVTSDLKRTVRYKIDDGDWVYVDNDISRLLDDETVQQIVIPYQSTATVEAWMTYKGKSSEVSTFSITNTTKNFKLYGSVNGASKEINHLYGSVNGQSKKIVKLYGSVGGVVKEIYRDV